MIALDKPKIYRKKRRPTNVPEYLVYEIIDGKPYYYNGYKDVLNKTKTFEEIMGTSSYQWKILEYLLRLLFKNLNENVYSIATNEPGLHLDRRNNLAGDILVFDKQELPSAAISKKYAAVPALLHIEVDIAADLEEEPSIIYLEKKVNKLLAFGTKKIIWVFTKNKRILVATGVTNWQWHDWNETLPLIDEVDFNIAGYLKAEGIEVNE
jgi:hypothetical protein